MFSRKSRRKNKKSIVFSPRPSSEWSLRGISLKMERALAWKYKLWKCIRERSCNLKFDYFEWLIIQWKFIGRYLTLRLFCVQVWDVSANSLLSHYALIRSERFRIFEWSLFRIILLKTEKIPRSYLESERKERIGAVIGLESLAKLRGKRSSAPELLTAVLKLLKNDPNYRL